MSIDYQGSGGGIPRKTAKIFASNATNNDVTVFGSTKANNTQYTDDIAFIQNSAFETGWRNAVISKKNYPLMGDMNGVQRTFSQQIAYMLQHGIPQWDSATIYYTYDIVNVSGVLYICTIDENVNNNPTTLSGWAVYYDPAAFETSWANTELSNLTTDGNDRLHALKGYLDKGELLTDSEGLADVKSYAHSTFDLSKFIQPSGSNVIADSNGIVENFSETNYFIQSLDFRNATSWEVVLKFKTPATFTSAGRIIDYNGSNKISIMVNEASRLNFGLDINGNTLVNLNFNFITYTPNTWYTVKYSYDGTYYNIDYSTDGENFTRKNQIESTQLWSAASLHNIGRGINNGLSFTGAFDLKYFSVKSDGIPVFLGNRTGIDTYTIDNSTVSIPYTLSKTGSKIVDSAYRSQVSAIYDEFGYAPYYTLSDTNFTLPQGEIYGMLGNRQFNFVNQTISTATSIATHSVSFVDKLPNDGFIYECLFSYFITVTVATGGTGQVEHDYLITSNGITYLQDSIDADASDTEGEGGQFTAYLKATDLLNITLNHTLTSHKLVFLGYKKADF